MDQLTDLTTLATVAGATALTPIIVQAIKVVLAAFGTDPGAVVWRALSLIIAVIILIGATILTGPAEIAVVVLALVNGIIAGVAASALYDGTHRLGVRTGIVGTD